MKRYSGTSWSVGTESSSSVWRCSTLIQPPGGTVQLEHSSRAGSLTPTPHLYQRKSSSANNSLCFFGMMLVCWNFVHGRLSALPDLSYMYKGFKSLKDIYKDKCNLHVTIPFLEKLRDQRVPLKGKEKGVIVPIRSGKRATAGLNIIVLGLEQGTKIRNDGRGTRFRNVKSWRKEGCNIVTFLKGGTRNILT